MPTGDEFVNASLKRFLSQNRIANELIDYLQENSFDIGARIFPSQGLFTYPVTIKTPAVKLFELSIAPAGSIFGTDGLGHTLELVLARQANIAFEDNAGDTYWIGMKYIEIPNEMYDNPRTGKPEYDKIMEEIGELDFPVTVADAGGGQIELVVDSIFENGVDHSGRTVRVWLVNPQSGDEAVAFEDCIVTYVHPENIITTAGSLGQGSISTTAANYQVACLGVSVRKSVANPFTDEYVIFGNIVSGAGIDTGDQVDLSGGGGHTLQRAYDGVGAGAGRNVTVDDQAIQLTQSSASSFDKDVADAVIRANKAADTTIPPGGYNYEGAFDAVMRILSHYGLMHRANLADLSGNDELRGEETVNLVVGTATVSFTRAGVDLTFGSGGAGVLQTTSDASFGDLIEISGSANSQDGVYLIVSVLAGSVDVVMPDGTVPVFVAEVGLTAKIYRPLVRSGFVGTGLILSTLSDFLSDIGLIGPGARVVVPTLFPNTPGLEVILADGSKTVQIRPNEIRSTDDITITGVTGEFRYNAARTFYKTIPASSGISNWDTVGKMPSWVPDNGAIGASVAVVSSVVSRYISWDIDLPDGATLVTVEIICKDKGVTIDFELIYFAPDWVTPAASTAQSLDTDTSSAGGVIEKVTLNPLACVIDNQNRSYQVRAKAGSVGDEIYDLRVTFTHTEIHY